ncbi:MAG: Rpn family recombination-promoting nuclease/putative transposase, partial [Polyangiaceae bacterium]|nr:Rpn family recombination-promoting nuclease/putative transposase [Polyangiaceae bacterium]
MSEEIKTLDPTNDAVFKFLVGSPHRDNLVFRHLASSFLGDRLSIRGARILNPVTSMTDVSTKGTLLDVLGKLDSGVMVDAEMQKIVDRDTFRRVYYYSTRHYQQQIGIGEEYAKLRLVVSIVFTDSAVFPASDSLHTVFLGPFDRDPFGFRDMFEIHLVEYGKARDPQQQKMVSPDVLRWALFFEAGTDDA